MNRIFSIILTLLVFIAAPLLQAAEVPGLFSASVAVESRDKEDFEQGLRDALVKVLSKASGQPAEEIRNEARIAIDLQEGHKLASLFSYFQREEDVINEDGEQETVEVTYLKASFPEKQVVELLRKAGMNLWPASRPRILLWPAVSIEGKKQLAREGNENTADIVEQLDKAIEEAGLPVVYTTSKNLEAAWDWDEASLSPSLVKQDAQWILASRMAISSNGRTLGGWLLFNEEKRFSMDITAENYQSFINQGITWVVETLAPIYSVKLMLSSNEMVLNIEGIDNEAVYQSMMQYLNKLDVVHSTYLLEVEGSSLSLAVTLKTDPGQFRKILALDKLLVDMQGQQMSDYAMSLFWNGD